MTWRVNPKYTIPDDIWDVYEIWYQALDLQSLREGCTGPGAVRWLPDPGGLNDQCAVLMDAYQIMSDTAQVILHELRTEPSD